jgi:hypothetical protein
VWSRCRRRRELNSPPPAAAVRHVRMLPLPVFQFQSNLVWDFMKPVGNFFNHKPLKLTIQSENEQ